jgi:hypothetical protein
MRVKQFRLREESAKDESHVGQPVEVVTEENISVQRGTTE